MRKLVAKARPVTRFGLPMPGAFALNKLRIGEVRLDRQTDRWMDGWVGRWIDR